ncbi:fibrous sheath-interacting protein 1 isoform X4 [Sphaerodactylus townsendi]|uniref:fibrous sheath-interacting protein 1 isoform X4 n=1 Tax=Sphaerodactylus townsendi TaxID=933632 RepID=UPI002025D9B5|nr:fibrous sheath-interacting protein 1 isoform X4 [Sphaerodactylus townsendi]
MRCSVRSISGITMDITRGSLDEISRPSSSSRINHRSRVLSASLEKLTPESGIPKVDYSLDLHHNSTEDGSKDNDEYGEEHKVKNPNASNGISEGKTNCTLQQLIQKSTQVEEPAAVDEDEMFTGVFHTQINSENYESRGNPVKKGYLNAERSRSSMKKTENMHQKTETSSKKPHNFIKKNIELVKEFGNHVVMMEEEKKRLSELMKDTEDESREVQVLEGEATGWLVPGEGYTPEPMEYHYLTELEAKLKIIITDGDFPAIQSSLSKVPKQIYQESLAYANRKLETVPGEKVFRDTKEGYNQQKRLEEIDQQLKNLETTPDVQPTVSKEQLNTLLEQYMQSQRTRLALPTSEGSFFDGMNPDFDQSENITQDSRNGLLEDTYGVVMLRKQNMVETMDKGVCSKETIETAGCNDSKALVESHLSEEPVTEKKENDDQVVQQEMLCTSNPAGYFMSIALSTGKPKKPSFLDEPFYCTSMNNELSTDVDIPSMPLKTRGGEVLNKPVE